MCGRYLIETKEFVPRFKLGEDTQIREIKNYNVAPGQILPVIISKDNLNRLQMMKWGLIPSWAKDDKIGYKMINARAETIAEKPAFRHAFKRNRCLIPATGFYEWQRLEEKTKTPYYIHPTDQKLFSFAGIYEHWTNPETKEEVLSYSIITTEPNELMSKIHNRMPVILEPKDEQQWLEDTDSDRLLKLLNQYPAEKMDMYPIGREVNTPANNYPELINHL